MGDFLEQIPIVSSIVKRCPSMDFEGQKLAEKLYQWVIILFAVVGFVWGYVCQQFAQTIYILGAGVALACVLTLPPWHLFRRNPLKWQESVVATNTSTTSTSNPATKKKERQRN